MRVAHAALRWAQRQVRQVTHLDEPVDEDGAHRGVDVALRLHIVRRRAVVHLPLAQVGVDVLHVVTAALRVRVVVRVNVGIDGHRDALVGRRRLLDHRRVMLRRLLRLRLQ